MRSLSEQLKLIAASDLPAIVSGLPGSGRRYVARTLHDLGCRRAKPFAVIDCHALNAALNVRIKSPDHRHTAVSALCERIAAQLVAADGGTVLFKDVDKLPMVLQGVLLPLIECGEVPTQMTAIPRKVDVRVIATHRSDLYRLVVAGKFRDDLLYRLDVLRLDVPRLRDRIEEITPLVQFFSERYAHWYRLPKCNIAAAALDALEAYPWPKNIQELRLLIEALAVAKAGGTIELGDLPTVVRQPRAPVPLPAMLMPAGFDPSPTERPLRVN